MKKTELIDQIRSKNSYLCVGLDSTYEKIPEHIKKTERPVFEFNRQIIDATAPYAIAYKPNLAFYECRGLEGWKDLELTAQYIKSTYPEIFLIADAKRGDIGNTSAMYAKAFFETMNFDAVTVAPYMGRDSVSPFLGYKDKYIIILALTSNAGSADFQYIKSANGKNLYVEVLEKSSLWGSDENTMYVVGATHASDFEEVRKIIPSHFLLVPGVGAQGGSLEDVAGKGMNSECGLIVNASRSVIFAGNGHDFAEKSAKECENMQQIMEISLRNKKII